MIPEFTDTNDGYRRLQLAATPSTNTECLNFAQQGDPGKLWVTADNQTQGRGSRGRHWETGAGNLFASLLYLPNVEVPVAALANLTFVAGLSLLHAINQAPAESKCQVELKWPNDVLLNGKKCAGILLETHQVRGRMAVIIGFGVNCAWSPSETVFPATNLQEEGIGGDKELIFNLLAHAMAVNLSRWRDGSGFRELRTEWLENAYNLGKNIVIKVPGKPDQIGRFKSIDEQGLLILQTQTAGEQKISTADIFPSTTTQPNS